jgi:hypothetical protein
MRRLAAVLVPAAAALALASPSFAAAPTSGSPELVRPFGSCGQVFNVTVSGGQASWNIECTNGTNAEIAGWVKDTEADGLCAYVKAFASTGASRVPLAKACPKGKVTFFDWTVPGATWINAYLFTA